MTRTRNIEAKNRARLARYLKACIRALQLTDKEVANALGVDTRRIRHLERTAPQLEVLHALGQYLQQVQERSLRKSA